MSLSPCHSAWCRAQPAPPFLLLHPEGLTHWSANPVPEPWVPIPLWWKKYTDALGVFVQETPVHLRRQNHSFLFNMEMYNTRICAESLQLCPPLCDPMDYSPPGCSVHRILQARLLEWATLSSSKGCSGRRDRMCIFYVSFTGRWVLYH